MHWFRSATRLTAYAASCRHESSGAEEVQVSVQLFPHQLLWGPEGAEGVRSSSCASTTQVPLWQALE